MTYHLLRGLAAIGIVRAIASHRVCPAADPSADLAMPSADGSSSRRGGFGVPNGVDVPLLYHAVTWENVEWLLSGCTNTGP